MSKAPLKDRLALLGGTALLALAIFGAILRRPFRRGPRLAARPGA